MYADELTEDEVIEAIVRAPRINKVIRSTGSHGEGKAPLNNVSYSSCENLRYSIAMSVTRCGRPALAH